jgi:uncharacterized protein (TIGR03000 family)
MLQTHSCLLVALAGCGIMLATATPVHAQPPATYPSAQGVMPPNPSSGYPAMQKAYIRVFLPDGKAQVAVDEHQTSATGASRLLETPPLQVGRTYTYTVKATWKQNGRTVTQERRVVVVPGQYAMANFTMPAPVGMVPAPPSSESSSYPGSPAGVPGGGFPGGGGPFAQGGGPWGGQGGGPGGGLPGAGGPFAQGGNSCFGGGGFAGFGFPSGVSPTLAWNSTQGWLDLKYKVFGEELKKDKEIEVHWAKGTCNADRLGNALFTHTVPAGTKPGEYGPIRITGPPLTNAPAGTTHILAASDTKFPLQDVQISFGKEANQAVVSDKSRGIIKDLLRAAGQAQVTITSTARTPADQARAMFQNLVNPKNPVAVNVANQLALYLPPGDAVIQVFVNMTQGQTQQQIVANQVAIRQAMEQEIMNQGPPNVSKHCADPAKLNVIDISAAAFNASNTKLFENAAKADARVSKFIDERKDNGCFHLEIPQ